jgi:PGF-pre-PGF domain-containing protein
MKKTASTLILLVALLSAVGMAAAQTAPSVEQNVFNLFPNDETSSFDIIIDENGEKDIQGTETKNVNYITNSSASFSFSGPSAAAEIKILDVDGNSSEKQNISRRYDDLQNEPVTGFNQTLDQQKYVSRYQLTNTIREESPFNGRSNFSYLAYVDGEGVPEDSSKNVYSPIDGFEDQDLVGWSTQTSGSNGVIQANTSQSTFTYEGGQAWHVRGDATIPEGKVFTAYRETEPTDNITGTRANVIFPLNNNNTAVNTFDLGVGDIATDGDRLFMEGNASHLNLRISNGTDEALLASRQYDQPLDIVNNWLETSIHYNKTSGIVHASVIDADTGEHYAEVARHVDTGEKNGDEVVLNDNELNSSYFSIDFYTPGSDNASVFIDNLGYSQATLTNSSSNRDFTYEGKIKRGVLQPGETDTVAANFTGDFIDLARTFQGLDVSEVQGQPHTLTNQFVNTEVRQLANNSVNVFFQDVYVGDICQNQVNGSMPPAVTQEEIANQCNLTQTQTNSVQVVQDILELPSNVNIQSNYDATNKLGVNNTQSFSFTDLNTSSFFKGYRDKLVFDKSYQGFENGIGNLQVIVPEDNEGDVLYNDTTTNRSFFGSSSLKFEGRANQSAGEFGFVAATFPISYSTNEEVKQISIYTYFEENNQGETAPSGVLSFSSQPTPHSDFLQLNFAPNFLALRAGDGQSGDNLGAKILGDNIRDQWVKLELTFDNTTKTAKGRILNATTGEEIKKIKSSLSSTDFVNSTQRFDDGFISGNFGSPTDTAQSIFYDNLSVSNNDFTRKEGCNLNSNGLVDVGNSSQNPTVNNLQMTCDTGEVTGGSLQQDNQSYNYSSTLDVYRSETEQSNLIYTIDNSQLPNISQAEGTPEVYLDGQKKPGIKVDVGASTTTINYTTDCCSSSPSAGTHDTKLSYSTSTTDDPNNNANNEDDDGGDDSGGGSDDEKISVEAEFLDPGFKADLGWIDTGQESEVFLPETETDAVIKEVNFEASEDAYSVNVEIENYENDFSSLEGVDDEPSGGVYSYHSIDVSGLDNSEVSDASVEFSVEKSFLEDRDASVDDVLLQRYDEGWESYEAEEIGEDEDSYTLSADVPGFSYYAVSVDTEEEVEEQEGDQQENQQDQTGENQSQEGEKNNVNRNQTGNQTGNEGQNKDETQKGFPLIPVLFVLLLVLAVAAGAAIYASDREIIGE